MYSGKQSKHISHTDTSIWSSDRISHAYCHIIQSHFHYCDAPSDHISHTAPSSDPISHTDMWRPTRFPAWHTGPTENISYSNKRHLIIFPILACHSTIYFHSSIQSDDHPFFLIILLCFWLHTFSTMRPYSSNTCCTLGYSDSQYWLPPRHQATYYAKSWFLQPFIHVSYSFLDFSLRYSSQTPASRRRTPQSMIFYIVTFQSVNQSFSFFPPKKYRKNLHPINFSKKN
jgi:hypothetical protein